MKKEELLKKRNTWQVLQKIKVLLKKNSDKERVCYLVHLLGEDGDISPDVQSQILLNLQAEKVLKLRKPDNENVVVIGVDEYCLEIFQPKFNQTYTNYKEIFSVDVKNLPGKNKKVDNIKADDLNENPLILKERLQRKFDSLGDVEDVIFFRRVADYVKSIDESVLLNRIVGDILEEREREYENLNSLASRCDKELEQTASKLANLLKKNSIRSERMSEAIDNYNGFRAGRIFSSPYSQNNDFSSLKNIVRTLNEEGHHDIAKQFAILGRNNYIEKYIFSPTCIYFFEEQHYLEEHRKNTIWGSWQEIVSVYLIIHKRKEFIKMIVDEDNPIDATYLRIDEMDELLNGKSPGAYPQHFVRKDFNYHINKVHDYFLTKLEDISTSKESYLKDHKDIQKVEVINAVRIKKDDIASRVSRFPGKLKAGTQWKNIILIFLDERNIIIHYNGKDYPNNYQKMGFVKGKLEKPTETWNFLEVLARHNGELFSNDPDAKPAFKKQKEFLTKAMQAYFQKEDDPFFPYEKSPEKQHRSYKTRFGVFYKQETEDDPHADLKSFISEQMSP